MTTTPDSALTGLTVATRSARPASAAGRAARFATALLLAGLVACSATVRAPAPGAAGGIAAIAAPDAALWLDRLTFGVDSAAAADFRRLGRAGFLDQQLSVDPRPLPVRIAAQTAAFDVARIDPVAEIETVRAERRRLNELGDPGAKEAGLKSLNEAGNRYAYQATARLLLEAVYSRQQIREQMVWFWLNHFSVFEHKADLRWLVADYDARAIRPLALGRFRDLVLASLVHPAMLQYLDNSQNAAGHVNENYARELMELHTLGVSAGYGQHDVQELARVLTGVGIAAQHRPPTLRPELAPYYRMEGGMEFNPARHDFGAKTLLGQPLRERGFAEVEEAVTRLVRSPACALFISRKLATYWVADQPPEALVKQLAGTFQRTDGDIAAVLRELFASREFAASLGGKFRDPYHYVVAAVRFAYDGRTIVNPRPLVNWVNALGEPTFGRQTPDGYPLTEAGWASSGQLSKRFEIARTIGGGAARLFEPEDGNRVPGGGFPQLASRLYFEVVEPRLSEQTRTALAQTTSQQEWNTLLLASPEFNYR
jgi:uncharacterized protein (DUF1800 family)